MDNLFICLKNKLDELVNRNELILIAPHVSPDCDAIASALGLYMIIKKMGKNPAIIISEDVTMLDRGVQLMLDEIPDSVKIIGKKSATKLIEDKSALLICTDNNKKELFPIEDYSLFNDIIVIDHHATGESTVCTENLFVDTIISSASEIVENLMKLYDIKFDYRNESNEDDITNIANYLLTGIYLDTDGLKNKRARSTTFVSISELVKSGADIAYASSLFIDDMKTDILIHDMIKSTDWKKFNIAIASNKQNPKAMYTKEILAKIADALIRYKDTDASFSLGLVENDLVHVSGRSKGLINMSEVMAELGGGGNETCGAAKIKTDDVLEVRAMIEEKIVPGYRVRIK